MNVNHVLPQSLLINSYGYPAHQLDGGSDKFNDVSLFKRQECHASNPIVKYINDELNADIRGEYSAKKKFLNAVYLAIKHYQWLLNQHQSYFNANIYPVDDYEVEVYRDLTNPDTADSFWGDRFNGYEVQEILKYIAQLHLQNKTARLGERSYRYKDDMIIYGSKRGDRSIHLNGQAQFNSGEGIFCRHLVFGWFRVGKDYHDKFSKKDLIKASISSNYYDQQGVVYKGDSYALFGLDDFGEQLYQLCNNMRCGEEKYIAITNVIHVMGLKVYYTMGNVVIKSYDPNLTAKHVVVRLYSELICLKNIALTDLLFIDRGDSCFSKSKCGMFTVYDNPHEVFSIKENHVFTQSNYSNIFSEDVFEQSQKLCLMLFFGYNQEAIKKVCNAICSKFDQSGDLTELLLAKNLVGTPGLWFAFQEGHIEAVSAVFDFVLNSEILSLEQKVQLLLAKNGKGIPGIIRAIIEGHTKIVKMFITAILNDNFFNPEHKFELLLAKYAGFNFYFIYKGTFNYFHRDEKLRDGVYCIKTENRYRYFQIIGHLKTELQLKCPPQNMSIYKNNQQLEDDVYEELFYNYNPYVGRFFRSLVNAGCIEVASEFVNIILLHKELFSYKQLSELLSVYGCNESYLNNLLSINHNLAKQNFILQHLQQNQNYQKCNCSIF